MNCCRTFCKPFFEHFFLLFCGLSGKSQSYTASGSQFVAPPCRPVHLPGPDHHCLSDAGRDINNKSWSRNHSQEHKRDTERRCGLCLALLQVPSFDTRPDGNLMGAHGVTRVYVHVYMCVYIASIVFMHSPPTLFSSLWRGIFLWQAASEKAIKNSQTAHHNGRYHLCNVCSISLAVLVWNGFGYF